MPRIIIEECANCNGQGDVRHMFQYKGVMVCSDRCADDWAEWLKDKEWEEKQDRTGTVYIGPDKKITGWVFDDET